MRCHHTFSARRLGFALVASSLMCLWGGLAAPAAAQVVYQANLDGSQITPVGSGTTSYGLGYFYHYADNKLRCDMSATGLATVDRAEVRMAAWGSGGSLVMTLGRVGTSAVWQGISPVPLSAAQVDALIHHRLYVVVFTSPGPYPNGEIRGQIVRNIAVNARYGNVKYVSGSPTPPEKVLTVNGSSGHPYYRAMTRPAGPATIEIAKPSVGGTGLYMFWIFPGEADMSTFSNAWLNDGSGGAEDLGNATECLPTVNTITPGICPGPGGSFPLGFTSKAIYGGPLASALSVPQGAATGKAPVQLAVNLPPGAYTIAGILHDPSKTSLTRRFSVMNSVVLHAQ